MGAYQRTKGHNFERKTARGFRILFPEAKRGYQSQDGGSTSSDVEGTPFHIECKKGKKIMLPAAVRQAERDSQSTGRPWLVVHQRDRDVELVTMKLSTFISLFSQLQMLSHLKQPLQDWYKKLFTGELYG